MKTYLINLDRQPERLESAIQELAKINLSPTRVSAVDMNDLAPNSGEFVTSGVQACWMSHLKTLQFISNGEDSMALVFEDDIEVLHAGKIAKLLNSSELSNWDLIQIGFITPGFLNKFTCAYRNVEQYFFKGISYISALNSLTRRIFGNRLRVHLASRVPSTFVGDDFLPGTHAYLISRDMAKSILSLNTPQFLSADDFYTALSHMRSFRCIRVRTALVSQKDFPGFGGKRFRNQEKM